MWHKITFTDDLELRYKRANIAHMQRCLHSWRNSNPPPEPPLKKRNNLVDGSKKMNLIKELYGKAVMRQLNRHQKAVVKEKLEEEAVYEPNPNDPEYKEQLAAYNNLVATERYKYLLESSVHPDDHTKAVKISLVPSWRMQLLMAIEDVSLITSRLIHESLQLVERYYNNKPFLEVLDVRGKKETNTGMGDAWGVKAQDLFINHSVFSTARELSIREQAQLAAELFAKDYVDYWRWEDTRPKGK